MNAELAETVIAEKRAKLEPRCVFCDKPKSMFEQPGKSLRNKWVCPDCRALIA